MVESSSVDAAGAASGHAGLAAASKRRLFMQLLALLLQLDADAVLAAEQNHKHASLLQPYLAILQLPCGPLLTMALMELGIAFAPGNLRFLQGPA